MIQFSRRFSRASRVVFVFAIVCVATIPAAANFTASATDQTLFTISGQVTENAVGLPGVTLTLTGSQLATRTTDSNGNYSFDVVGGGDYVVTPSATGLHFDPTNLTVINLSESRIGNFAANRENLVVTNANDNGPGSLREAIANANATIGKDTIVFNIPGAGVKTISLQTPLPEITDTAVIDASTQPGYASTPLVELDGANILSADGLVITASHSTVRGLAIGNFRAAGILLRSCANNIIERNHIGVDATGTVARPNNTGILLSVSTNNIIGRNLISGNSTGVSLFSNGNTIQGNLIGTDVTGTHKIGNGRIGIEAEGSNTLIGGLTPAARNVISGNGTGVIIGQLGSQLQGNFIGTDITGTVALGNTLDGVVADHGVVIGGTVPEARNVISGNGVTNLSLGLNEFVIRNPNIVRGNYIGTDVTGTRALVDPVLSATKSGILVFSSFNVIGGSFSGAQNVVSGNAVGIRVKMTNAGQPMGNALQGNLIGLNAAGTGPLPNTQAGIELSDTRGNGIGGTWSGAANKIAFNGGPGVIVLSNSFNNWIRGNSIFSNAGLGIDLGNNGVTANDPNDSDVGANNLQNFPVITSVMAVGNSTTIHGSLSSTPNTTFQIDFYTSAALDSSGNGQGALFFNTSPVTTDSNGNATIDVTVPMPLETGRVVTATATDPDGNTSEFSPGDATGATGNLQFSVSSIRVIEDVGVASVTVLRKSGITGTLTVDYATVDGTAIGGQDYTSTSGTLSFGSGETSKNIQIPITDDAITEADETFTVTLQNASSLDVLGVPHTLVVTIQDRSTVPVISATAPTVVEGNAGSTQQAVFTFNLSAATGRLVTVNIATHDLDALGSSSCGNASTDYESVSGTISFQPGITSVAVPVTVCGDNRAEQTETFRLNLSAVTNATLSLSSLDGAIVDDDALELLRDNSGPAVNQAAALDALFTIRDPFRVVLPEWWPATGDRNTRVMFFVRGVELDPRETASDISVHFLVSNNLLVSVAAEDLRAVPGVDFKQLVVRLPNNLAEGTYTIIIQIHSRFSNAGTIRIGP